MLCRNITVNYTTAGVCRQYLNHLNQIAETHSTELKSFVGKHSTPVSHFNMKTILPGMGIFMLKIKQAWDCLIFNMVIPILVGWHFYIETAPIFSFNMKTALLSMGISIIRKRQMWVDHRWYSQNSISNSIIFVYQISRIGKEWCHSGWYQQAIIWYKGISTWSLTKGILTCFYSQPIIHMVCQPIIIEDIPWILHMFFLCIVVFFKLNITWLSLQQWSDPEQYGQINYLNN